MYRLNHSRKLNRQATNEDIFNNLLVTSDPYISAKRHKFLRKHKTLSEEVNTLLIIHSTTNIMIDKENKESIV